MCMRLARYISVVLLNNKQDVRLRPKIGTKIFLYASTLKTHQLRSIAFFTRGADGQYSVVVCIAALSHSIESVDREVVRRGRFEARGGINSCRWRINIHIHVADGSRPLVPVKKTDANVYQGVI